MQAVAEILRTFTIIEGAVMVGLVTRLYFVKVRQERSHKRTSSQLPSWAVTCWIILTMLVLGGVVERYGDPMTFQTPIATAGIGVGVWGALKVLRLEGR